MKFIDQLKEKAKQNKKTIVLPETSDMRTIEAAGKVLAEGIANITPGWRQGRYHEQSW